MFRLGLTLAVALAALLVAACTGLPASSPSPQPTPGADPTAGASPTPVVTPGATPSATAAPSASPTPAASPSPSAAPSGVVVTFRVVEEEFRILITETALISHVQQLLAGGEEGRIPSGLIVRGETGVNEGWSWSIDPASLEFADMTIEVCDGLPSHVEDGTLTGERFCPWSAEVIDIQPVP